jgi:hypothetical protein
VQELAEVVVAGADGGSGDFPLLQCHGIRPVLWLLGCGELRLTCLLQALAAGPHYPERGKHPDQMWEMELVMLTKSVEINSNNRQASGAGGAKLRRRAEVRRRPEVGGR